MEHKDKYRVHAHTFIPSVERLEDNPSLIQLASKAKDAGQALSNVNVNELKNNSKKPLSKPVDCNLKTQRSSHVIVSDKITNVGKKLDIDKSASEISGSGFFTKKTIEMTSHQSGDFALSHKRRFPTKSSARGSDYNPNSTVSSNVALNQSSYSRASPKVRARIADYLAACYGRRI